MTAAYSAAVRERCREPRRAGAWPDGDRAVATGSAGSLDAGALTRLQMRVGPDGRVEDTRFKVFGCSAAIASASYVADALVGVTLADAKALAAADVAAALDLPQEKHAMAVLATEAAGAAVDAWHAAARAGVAGSGTKEVVS